MSVELVSIAPNVDRPIRSTTVRKRQQRVPYLDVRTTRHAAMTARETLQHTQRLIVYWSPYEPNIAAMLAGAAIDGLVADAEIRRAGTAWGPASASASPSGSQAQKSRSPRRCRQGDPVLAEPPPASGGASGVPCSAQLRSARQTPYRLSIGQRLAKGQPAFLMMQARQWRARQRAEGLAAGLAGESA